MGATTASRRVLEQSRAATRDLAASMLSMMGGPRLKSAQTGGSDTGFEQAFASLAYTYLKDKAPRLLDHFVGFQLVDRDDDKTKAFGIMGFKVGDQWMDAPVFFLNGQLKGHELLFLKGPNQMVPLKENWVNFLLGKKPTVLGEAESKSLSELGTTQPNLLRYTVPPPSTKIGAAIQRWQPWAKEAAASIVDLATTSPWKKYPGLDERLSVPSVLKHSLYLCKVAHAWMERYPAFAAAMHRFYGPNMLKEAVLAHRSRILGEMRPSSILDARQERPQHVIDRAERVLGERRPVSSSGVKCAVEVLFPSQNRVTLTEAEREKLLRNGYLVRDFRKEAEVSQAYQVETRKAIHTPTETGMHSVLMADGSFVRCLVLVSPKSATLGWPSMIVVRLSPRDIVAAKSSDVFAQVLDEEVSGTRREWFDEVPNDDVDVGATFVIVSPQGDCAGPFYVDGKDDDSYIVSQGYCRTARDSNPSCTAGPPNKMISRIVRGGGARLRQAGDTLYVPADAKFVRESPPDPKRPLSAQPQRMLLGRPEDLDAQIRRKTAALRLHVDGVEVSINGGPLLSKMAAMVELIQKHGFREKTARQLLAQAEKAAVLHRAATFRVKYAQGMPPAMGMPPAWIGPGPAAPVPEPPPTVSDPMVGQTIQYPWEQRLMSPEMSSANYDPRAYSVLPQDQKPDPALMQTIMQAAQSGQKEIFDTSVLAGLMRTSRHDSLVERYMGDLLKALDRLGRLIFVFYWHNDVFADRYGRAELPELEDALRNTFEGLGDLVLYLKEKDVTPLSGFAADEPNLDDVAASL